MKTDIKQIRACNLPWVLWMALAAMIGSQAAVHAQGSPSQGWNLRAYENSSGVTGTSSGANFSTSTSDVAGDSASVAIGLTGPSVTVTAIEPYSTANPNLGAFAQAQFVYGITIVNTGGGTAISVPLVYQDRGTVSANLTAAGSFVPGSNFGDASVVFGTLLSGSVTPTFNLGSASIAGDTQLGALSNSFTTMSGTINVNPANGPYGLELAVDVEVGSSASTNEQGATMSATVDPIIMIDPTFSQAGDYTLQIAPGIVQGVPEPSIWAMLAIGGAGLLWIAGRGGRKTRILTPIVTARGD